MAAPIESDRYGTHNAVADTSSGVATYPVTVEFRSDSGDFNDGEDCAGDSQLEKLIDLDEVPKDPDLPNDVDPAN